MIGDKSSQLDFTPDTTINKRLALGHGAETGSLSEAARADNRGKRIGILIVAYNAVTTIAKVLKRIPPEVWQNVEEVVIFDDASKDETYELAMGLKSLTHLPKLHVIKHQANLGYGGNQKAGYRYFIEKGFDIAVLLHGDGQYAPEILSHIYGPIAAGRADAVFGSRMMDEYGGPLKGGMPLYKYVGNRILTTFENRALGMHLTEFHSGYRAYSLEALKKIDFTDMTNDFHFDTEIIVKLHHQGFRIHETPIPTYYGGEICYVNGMKYAGDVFRSILRYQKTLRSVSCYPEYKEYFVHYPLKASKHSSHYYFVHLTGRNHKVLDVGCGEGFFARRLVREDNRITGIDVLPEIKCRNSVEQYIQADLDAGLGEAKPQLAGQKFDRILLQDVLEHLRYPDRMLKDCAEFVAPQGQVLVSLPNIANITVRLMLLLGRFDYTERGILDKTHVRFYTRRTARKLLKENGYSVVQEKTTVMPIELVLGLSPENPLMRLLTGILALMTMLLPTLLGYQHIFVAVPKTEGPEKSPREMKG